MKRRGLIEVGWLAAANSWAFAPSAAAQDSADAIVVTGERIARTTAATPSSVSVVTADTIEALPGADRLDQLLALTPNLQLGSGGEGPTIRGQDTNGPLRDMPAFLGGNRPRVTLQVDGRPVGYNELAFGVSGLWDVARIEVFRSPQTTTQGRNAIAGAIFVETAAPSFAWQARARALVGEAETRQASAAVSGPIVPDILAFRAAGDIRRSSPSSRITGPAPGVDYNRDAYEIFRLKLLATPPAVPGLRVETIVSHNHSSAPQIEGVRAPFRDHRDPEATYGLFKLRVDALTLRAAYGFAPGWNADVVVTKGDATIRRLAPPGFGVARIEASDRTAESVVTWRPRDQLNVLAGVNLTHAALDQSIDLRAALLGLGEFRDRQDALGLFAQGEWQVGSATLTAGARYQRDDQDRTGVLGIGNPIPLPLDFRQRYSRFLPKVSASFEVAAGVRVGALVQRAYNPGGVTLDARRRAVDAFAAETLWAYEAFARIEPPGAALQLSANAFRYDMTNAQRSIMQALPTPGGIVTVAEIGNVPSAYSIGAEIEGHWQPSRKVGVRASIGLLRTRVTRTLDPADPLLGKEFQRSPHFTGALAVDWRPFADLRLSGNLRHNSRYFSEDANDPARGVSSATVADVGAAWRHGPLTLSGYVRNVFDQFYLTYVYLPSQRLATAGDPREAGASLELQF